MKDYNLSLDIVRIFSAFFVVFSHTTDLFVLYLPFKGSFSWNLIYLLNTLSRVAVPLFIILSGYLVLSPKKTQNISQFYKKRFSRVLIPLLVFVPLYFLWANFWGHVKLTFQFVTHIIWTGDFWHLYFIVIIMELYLLAPFISKWTQTKNRQKETIIFFGLMIFSIFCAALAFIPHHPIDLRTNILTMFIPYIGFFYAGAYFKDFKVKKWQVLLFGASYLMLGIITNLIARGDTNAFIVHNYGPTLLLMSLLLFLAIKDIDQFFSKKTFSKLKKPIMMIAGATFGIYILHYAVLDAVREYTHLYPWQIKTPIVFYAILPAIITFAISLTVVFFVRKLPYAKYILG